MIEELARILDSALPGSYSRDEELARLTTYRLGGPAALFVRVDQESSLDAFAQAYSSLQQPPPVLVVGRGSNLVISDDGWPGVALRLGDAFSWTSTDGTHVEAGGATPLPQVANKAARSGLGGAEFMIAIPGSVGGAVKMNAGAHGSDMSRVLAAATILDLRSGHRRTDPVDALGLTYRHSSLVPEEIVVSATLDLRSDDTVAVRERMEEHRRHRAETQPGAAQNAGSVFKNPPGDSAGRLVDSLGLKGFTVGGASVSTLHANFFIAGPGARAQDVFDLVHEVKARVLDACGVELEPEIRFVGRFEGDR